MPLFNRQISIDVAGLLIKGLRIDFNVEKDRKECVADITITNISRETAGRIRENQSLILKAGYSENTLDGDEIIFKGDVFYISGVRNTGPDSILNIVCKSGLVDIDKKAIEVSADPGASGNALMEKILRIAEINSKKLANVPDVKLENGYSNLGKVSDSINHVADTLNVDWSVQDGVFKTIPKKGNDNNPVYRISPRTGLIGTPERLRDSGTDNSETEGDYIKKIGYSVKSLLNSKYEVGNKIELDFSGLTQPELYIIDKVRHSGDSFGSNFFSDIDVVEYL